MAETIPSGTASPAVCVSIALLAATALAAGCADTGTMGGTTYGETSTPATTTSTNASDRSGWITGIEVIKVDDNYKLGIGTVVGAVAGGLLGSQVGGCDGRIVGGVVGAGVGAAAGTYAESRLRNKDAQRVTVQMATGGQLTVLQPPDGRLQNGMNVWVQGSGDSARVVPRSDAPQPVRLLRLDPGRLHHLRPARDLLLWRDTVKALRQKGIARFIEVGPSDVLSRLVRWIDRDTESLKAEELVPCQSP